MKKLLSVAASAMILTSAAFATTDGTCVNMGTAGDNVCMKTDGIGDYLVVPAYFANENGWETTIRVTNTDSANAVIAKVVFRESVNSVEKLDFLLYLSPNDVWDGTVSWTGSEVKIYSTDDSTIIGGVQTSATNPLDRAFFSENTGENYKQGYVEIFGGEKIPGNQIVAGWTQGAIDKMKIKAAYEAQDATKYTYADVDSALYASAFVNSTADKLSMNVPTTAFSGFATTPRVLSTAANTGLAETTERTANAILNAIDTLLYKNMVYVDYSGTDSVNDTALYLTTPTKKYWNDVAGALIAGNSPTTVTTPYYSWVDADGNKVLTQRSELCYAYLFSAYDMSENTPTAPTTDFSGGTTPSNWKAQCNELSKISVSGDTDVQSYKNGVAKINFAKPTPVIPVAVSAVTVSGQAITSASTPKFK